jgi:hypothetical protein
MKKLLIALLVFGLLVAFSTTAFATLIGGPPGQQKNEPWGYISLNDTVYPFQGKILPSGDVQFKKLKIKEDDFQFELEAFGKIDPFLTYGVTAYNSSSTTTLVTHIGLGIPINIDGNPVSGPNTVYAYLGGYLGDIDRDGVTITPVGDYDGDGVDELASHWVRDADGTEANMGVDLGPAYTGGAGPYGPYEDPVALAEKAGPIGDWVYMWEELRFEISPKDSYTFSGYLSIDPDESQPPPAAHTPEPGTLMLLGSGLLGLGAVGFRRYRKKA